MKHFAKPPALLTLTHPDTQYRTNSWQMKSVPVALIKVSSKPVKPASARAVALCKGHMLGGRQPRPLVVSDNLELIEGLEFLIAAKELGWSHIDVAPLSHLTQNDIRILTIALAKLPYLSEWDEAVLSFDLQEIMNYDLELLDLTGFVMGEIDEVIDPHPSEDESSPLDELPNTPGDREIVSRLGDVFWLGVNKIRCGDSREEYNILTLLDGENAQAAITDPPYNLGIPNNVSGLGKNKHKNFAMAVGEMSRDDFTKFLSAALSICRGCLVPGGLVYVFMGRRQVGELCNAADLNEMKMLDLGIWDKGSGAMGSFYRSQIEACGIFKIDNHPHINNVQLGRFGRNRTNLWKHRGLSSFGKGRDEALAMHPTVKPVNLLAELIKDCTNRGNIVLDLFLGSGSTILAAEKTGRRCYGIEIEPKYVDVAIQRWELMTGEQAVHAHSKMTFAELRLERQRTVDSTPLTGADHDR